MQLHTTCPQGGSAMPLLQKGDLKCLIFDGKLLGKYDNPMDPTGNFLNVSMVRVILLMVQKSGKLTS